MDKIQKTLIKAGHKDLAQEYYNKIAKAPEPEDALKFFQKRLPIYKMLIKAIPSDKKWGVEEEAEKNRKKVIDLVKRMKNDIKKLENIKNSLRHVFAIREHG